jgi:hypothetical protein
MTELQASRTLVKSPPELWAECSDAAALARHLDGFGEIRITRLDPETAVAWEGERARGTVRIEPAGWGTKVVLTAERLTEEAAPPEPASPPEPPPEPSLPSVEAEPDPVAITETPPPRRRFGRLRAFFRGPDPAEPPPEAPPPPVAPDSPAADSPAADSPEPPAAESPEPPAAESPPAATETEPVATETEAALAAALDSLGQAHHRPYSRA